MQKYIFSNLGMFGYHIHFVQIEMDIKEIQVSESIQSAIMSETA